jgi:outer membrane protein
MTRSGRVWTRAAVVLLLAGSPVACSPSPFAEDESDFGQKITPERLRAIQTMEIERYRKRNETAAATDQPSATEIKSRFQGAETRELSLEDCRASVLTNNLDLKVAIVDPTIAQQRLDQEASKFESAFTLRGQWIETDSPSIDATQSSGRRVNSIIPGVKVPLRTGGTATVSLPLSRTEDFSDFAFSNLNPAYTSDLEFSISHPLLRGAGRRANTASIRIASYDQQASQARTKLEAIRQIAAADRSYWRLYRARRELEVAQQQYELALEQQSRAERKAKVGSIREIEVVRAQAGAASRLETIINTQNEVLTQQRELKRILNRTDLPIESRTFVIPLSPPDPVLFEFDAPALISQALDNRMEMLELELRLAADAATIALNKNQALPLLNLDYTYRINGLGRTASKSFEQLAENDFEDWQLGLSAEIPLNNEQARARVRESLLARIQRLSSKDARELAIRQEVLAAIDNLDAGWQRILAARQSVILNTRALQAEQRQFDVQSSTSTDVLNALANLAESQVAEIRALTDYQIAQVDLAFATGTLLGAGKIEWTPVDAPSHESETPPEELPPALRAAPPAQPPPAQPPPPTPDPAPAQPATPAETAEAPK